MDWNTIYNAISPYLGTTTIAAGIIVGILAILCVKHLPERLTKFE